MTSPEQRQVRVLMVMLGLVAGILSCFAWWITLTDESGRIGWWLPVACTAVPIVAGVGFVVYRRVQARRAAGRLEQVMSSPPSDRESPEVMRLRSEFDRAVTALKASKLGRAAGRNALYHLPWYAVIGPAGCGKSTLLQQSGLHFPHLDGTGARPNLKGRGGTRNCDWFLTQDAILIDTAGRWSTDQAREDRQEWRAFLKELRKNRPAAPLNGILVAVSLADDAEEGVEPTLDDFPSIAGLDDPELETLAARIRERLDEISQVLGVIVPVYVLLTKCDLVSGFSDTFGGLSEQERRQIWGFSARVGEAGAEPGGLVRRRLQALERQLDRRTLLRMSELVGDEALARASAFPQQFRALRPKIVRFVDALLRPNPFTEQPVLRGVYFTCGTQEGTPVSLIAEELGVDPDGEDGDGVRKGYFVYDLLRSVVFRDRDLVAATGREAARRRLIRRTWMSITTVAASMLLAVAVFGFNDNGFALAQTRQVVHALDAARSRAATPFSALDALGALERELERYERGQERVWSAALDQGSRVTPGLEGYFAREVARHIITPLYSKNNGALHLARPSDNSADTVQVIANALQVALKLANRDQLALIDAGYGGGDSCGDCQIPSVGEDDVLLGQLLALWDRCFPPPAQTAQAADAPRSCSRVADFASLDPAAATDLAAQGRKRNGRRYRVLKRYLQIVSPSRDRPPIPGYAMRPDAGIQRARRALMAEDPAQRALMGLRSREGLAGDITLQSWPSAGPLTLPRVYVARGRQAALSAAHGGGILSSRFEQARWVLGCGCQGAISSPQATRDQLLSTYFQQRERAWREALAALEVAPPASLAQAARQLQELAVGSSLRRFFDQLKEHTQPRPPPPRLPEGADELKKRAQALVDAPAPPPDPFAGLKAFGDQQATAYQNTAAGVLAKLQAYQEDGTDANLRALRDATSQALHSVEAQGLVADGWTDVLERWLLPPFRGLHMLLGAEDVRIERRGRAELVERLQAAWCAEFYADYRDYIAGRFPFERHFIGPQGRRLPLGSVPQASFRKFEALFGKGGTLERLVEAGPLAGYVKRQGRYYRAAGASGLISADLLRFLTDTAVVRDAIFESGVRFSVGIASEAPAKLMLGDRPVSSGGTGTWPSNGVQVVTEAGEKWTMAGPWGLLLLMDGFGCADTNDALCELTGRCEQGCSSELARVSTTSSQDSPCGTRACYYGLHERGRIVTRTPHEVRIGLVPRHGRRTYISLQFAGDPDADPLTTPGYFSRLSPPERIVAGGGACR
ncbi:MAG: type VI secretion system membrane subunit TssM [Myxococcales bacterium]|nr:type VI secretion system membrane subunit TssM [Myxococcales bacterium]